MPEEPKTNEIIPKTNEISISELTSIFDLWKKVTGERFQLIKDLEKIENLSLERNQIKAFGYDFLRFLEDFKKLESESPAIPPVDLELKPYSPEDLTKPSPGLFAEIKLFLERELRERTVYERKFTTLSPITKFKLIASPLLSFFGAALLFLFYKETYIWITTLYFGLLCLLYGYIFLKYTRRARDSEI